MKDTLASFLAALLESKEVLLSGLGVTLLLAFFKWIDRYGLVPWLPIRYLRALKYDPRISRWQKNPAVLHTVRVRRNSAKTKRYPLLKLLGENVASKDRLLILGDSGSGKTATLEALTHSLACQAYSAILFSMLIVLGTTWIVCALISPAGLFLLATLPFIGLLGQRWPIPVFIELRTFDGGLLDDHIKQTLQTSAGGTWLADRFQNLAMKKRLVLIFDGINEVSVQASESAVVAWRALFKPASHFAALPMIFSSRDIEEQAELLPSIKRIFICDLDDSGVRDCLKYYGSKEIDRDFSRLKTSEMLQDFGIGRNPYWLKMMVESDLYSRNRGDLFNTFIKSTLLGEQKEGDPGIEDQLELLANLARFMSDSGSVGAELANIPEAVLPAGTDAKLILSRAQSAKLIRQSIPRQRIDFSHQLIQEYFTAYSLLTNQDAIFEHINEFRWWGTFLMLGGLLQAESFRAHISIESEEGYRHLVERIIQRPDAQHGLLLAFGLLCTITEPIEALERKVMLRFIRTIEQKPDQKSAAAALIKITEIAEDDVTAGLIRFLGNESDNAAKKTLLLLLASFKSSRIATVLATQLDGELREDAENSLLAMQEVSILPLLLGSAVVNDAVRKRRLAVIVRMHVEAIPALIAVLTDSHAALHKSAAEALVAIGGDEVCERLVDLFTRADANIRARASAALCAIGQPAIRSLIGALSKGNANIQSSAIRTLQSMGNIAVGALVDEWFSLEKTDLRLRLAIIEVLSEIGDNAAESLLFNAQKDRIKLVRTKASKALVNQGRLKFFARQKVEKKGRWFAPLIDTCVFLTASYLQLNFLAPSSSHTIAIVLYATVMLISMTAFGNYRSSREGRRPATIRAASAVLLGTLLVWVGGYIGWTPSGPLAFGVSLLLILIIRLVRTSNPFRGQRP